MVARFGPRLDDGPTGTQRQLRVHATLLRPPPGLLRLAALGFAGAGPLEEVEPVPEIDTGIHEIRDERYVAGQTV